MLPGPEGWNESHKENSKRKKGIKDKVMMMMMMMMMADQLLAIMYSIKYPSHVHGTSFSLSLSDGGSQNTYSSGKKGRGRELKLEIPSLP